MRLTTFIYIYDGTNRLDDEAPSGVYTLQFPDGTVIGDDADDDVWRACNEAFDKVIEEIGMSDVLLDRLDISHFSDKFGNIRRNEYWGVYKR